MTAVRKQITVDTNQQRAFRVFTDGIDRWWPREHHIGSSPLARAVIEPRVGGRWYSVCADDSEVDIGRVLVWDPPARVVLTWQITAAWQFDPAFVTEVEVNFIAETPRRTRVELEHRKLEAYGDATAAMVETFEKPDAWARTLEMYGTASAAAKHALIYDTTPASMAHAAAHFPAHRERLAAFHARGTLLMAGPLMTSQRALAIFTTRAAAEEFIREDPFVVGGVVTSWTLEEYRDPLF